jgi:single-strand DNA-binding protein
MNDSNQCFFIGRLTKVPFDCIKKLDNGNTHLSIGLAVKSTSIDKSGQPYERTDFPQLSIWNALAETTARDLQKGMEVEVIGQLQTRRYKSDNGQTWRYVTEILVSGIRPKSRVALVV